MFPSKRRNVRSSFSFLYTTLLATTATLLTVFWWQEHDPKFRADSIYDIKDKSLHSLYHKTLKTFSPFVFNNLQRATSFCTSFFTNQSSDVVFYPNSKQLYGILWKRLSLARQIQTLVQSASICISLPLRTLLYRIASKPFNTDFSVENKVLLSCLHASSCTTSIRHWSALPAHTVNCVYIFSSINGITGAHIVLSS